MPESNDSNNKPSGADVEFIPEVKQVHTPINGEAANHKTQRCKENDEPITPYQKKTLLTARCGVYVAIAVFMVYALQLRTMNHQLERMDEQLDQMGREAPKPTR